MKKAISLLILVLVVLAGGYLYFNANSVALRMAERVSSKALGVDVKIADLSLFLAKKKVIVEGIQIANPPGYKGHNIMEVQRVDIGLDTVGKNLIDFNNIEVIGSVVNVEANESGINVVDFKKMVTAPERQKSSANEALQVIIKKMAINATTINTNVTFLDKDIASVTMPAMYFTNIGKGQGIDVSAALEQIFVRYASAIQNQVGRENLLQSLNIPGMEGGDLGKVIKEGADSIKGQIKGLFN